MPISFSHRHCPTCGAPVGWRRFLLKSGIFVRWPCPACGTRLKFSWQRRLWMGIGLVVAIGITALLTLLLVESLGLPVQPVGIVVYLLLALPLLWLDGVEVA